MAELEKSFGSNTCRCTGFRPILDTMKSFASDATPQLRQKVRDIEDLYICKRNRSKCEDKCIEENKFLDIEDFDCLIEDYVKIESTIAFDFGKSKFVKVFEENDVFDVWSKYGTNDYALVDGNTGKGYYYLIHYTNNIMRSMTNALARRSWFCEIYGHFNLLIRRTMSMTLCLPGFLCFRFFNSRKILNIYLSTYQFSGIYETYVYPRVLVDISDIQSLKTFGIDQNLILGANVSLEDCIGIFKDTAMKYSDFAYLTEFVKHFELIAHIPVRKVSDSVSGYELD